MKIEIAAATDVEAVVVAGAHLAAIGQELAAFFGVAEDGVDGGGQVFAVLGLAGFQSRDLRLQFANPCFFLHRVSAPCRRGTCRKNASDAAHEPRLPVEHD